MASNNRAARRHPEPAPTPLRRRGSQPPKALPPGVIPNADRTADQIAPAELSFFKLMLEVRNQVLSNLISSVPPEILAGFLAASGAAPEMLEKLKGADAGLQTLYERYNFTSLDGVDLSTGAIQRRVGAPAPNIEAESSAPADDDEDEDEEDEDDEE